MILKYEIADLESDQNNMLIAGIRKSSIQNI